MDRRLRIAAAILAAAAGILQIYNASMERPAGEPFTVGGIATGIFYLALALYLYSGGRTEKR